MKTGTEFSELRPYLYLMKNFLWLRKVGHSCTYYNHEKSNLFYQTNTN